MNEHLKGAINMQNPDHEQILSSLRKLSRPQNLEGMARYGIKTDKAFGISIPELRKLARTVGKNHSLALELWESGYHEARILAGMVDDPAQLSSKQMDDWTAAFNSWDLCDQCCNNLFAFSPLAHAKALDWSRQPQEFVKRAGFVMMAVLAVHEKKDADKQFISFLKIIEKAATDERNYVRKAVNWALRQIGKRNLVLNNSAIQTAEKIREMNSKSAKWIASDALRELTDEKILNRIKFRKAGK
jgi:3-methyladenine DNA glycosylase AlkD